MPQQTGLPYLREALLFLVLAGVLVPLLQRLRINQVLGFLAVGALTGPFGLGLLAADVPWLSYFTFPRRDGVEALAELGVLFLMFMIGLELSAERVWSMRRWVFGAGIAQVLLSALVIGGLAYAFGNRRETAVVLGLVLALSSTAVVVELLGQRKELGSELGRAAFAVLLLQDLAVVPLLILVGILGTRSDAGFGAALGLALVKAVAAIALIYVAGRRLIRPLFRQFAQMRQPDVFVALTLLSTLGIAALTWQAGLSMALGAFLAGLLIAETEYRHEVEVTIEPFKGLLMGLFFMSVGMGTDVREILREPLWVLLSVVGLFALKGMVAALVLRAGGLATGRALEGGLLLGQGGEFAFIVIGAAATMGLMPARTAQFMMLVVALSLFATPVVARLGRLLGEAWMVRHRPLPAEAAEAALPEVADHVVIAGFGRVGQLLAQLLETQHVSFVAVENDARVVARLHPRGVPVYYGDASRPELLRRLGLHRAAAVVLTMDHMASALHAVRSIRRESSTVPVFVRARDEKHALALKQAGATMVIPETLESGLQLAAFVLQALGVPEPAVSTVVEQERDRRILSYRTKPETEA